MSLQNDLISYGWTLSPNGGVENYGINIKYEEGKKLELDESNNIVVVNSENSEDIILTEISILDNMKIASFATKGFLNWLKVTDKNNKTVYSEIKNVTNGIEEKKHGPIDLYKNLLFIPINEKIVKRSPIGIKQFSL